jgi:hypothetical protein
VESLLFTSHARHAQIWRSTSRRSRSRPAAGAGVDRLADELLPEALGGDTW